MDAIKLTVEQDFEIVRMGRTIDETDDVATLQNMCKLLLSSWMHQKAANAWIIRTQEAKAPQTDWSAAAREVRP